MYERMLDRQNKPELAAMTAYCGDAAQWFTRLNAWLSAVQGTAQEISFPYGNHYGWGVTHRKNKKLICHVFAEAGAFTVMLRLSGSQFETVYGQVRPETQALIDHKYPCGDGGWLHFRVNGEDQFKDVQKLLAAKCPHQN